MSKRSNSVVEMDKRACLHPYTNLKTHEETGPLVMSRGDGVYVYGEDGRQYLEGLSGLWCCALGFSEKRLVDAAHAQMQRLPFYHSFSGKVPEISARLAQDLVDFTPKGLDRVFFCNSGSEANDTAIKIAWYYNNARGKPEKKKIISRLNSYHGVTVAAGSMTRLAYAQNGFDLPVGGLFLQTACPHYYRYAKDGESENDFVTRLINELEDLILHEGPDTIAAFFAEPVQGAGGVLIPPQTYFAKLRTLLKKYDILLIADEVICGFGRLGDWFGSETFDLQPDMMTLAKQLSGGYQPISALMVSDAIYQPVRDFSNVNGVFGHGLTYGGHPVPAAVASEALKIYQEDNILERVRAMAPLFEAKIQSYRDHPLVGDARNLGLIGALELVADKASRTAFDPSQKVAARLVQACEAEGLILRAMPADCLAFCPPLIIEEQELNDLFNRFDKALASFKV